jgi:multidrug efflux pump subunit AcrB
MQQRLLQIEGVGQVNIGGGALPAVRLEINPTQLNNTGLSLEDVRAMLSQQNANIPKGQLSDERKTADILANDQLLKAKNYEPLIVAYRNGAPVTLSDIASVNDSSRTFGGRLSQWQTGHCAGDLSSAGRKHHPNGRSRQSSAASLKASFHRNVHRLF